MKISIGRFFADGGLFWHFNYILKASAALKQVSVCLNRYKKWKTAAKIPAQPLSRGLRSVSIFSYDNVIKKQRREYEQGTILKWSDLTEFTRRL